MSNIQEQSISASCIKESIPAGNYTFKINRFRQFELIITGNVAFFIPDLNNGEGLSFTVKLTGDFVPTLTDVNVYGDSYDGTIQNLLTFNSYRTSAGTQVNDLIITNLA